MTNDKAGFIYAALTRFLAFLGGSKTGGTYSPQDPTSWERVKAKVWLPFRKGEYGLEPVLCIVDLRDETWGWELKVSGPDISVEWYVPMPNPSGGLLDAKIRFDQKAGEPIDLEGMFEVILANGEPNQKARCDADDCGRMFDSPRLPHEYGNAETGPMGFERMYCPDCLAKYDREEDDGDRFDSDPNQRPEGMSTTGGGI